jgi:DNA polymerase III alpha subunit (gram-positive type)
MYIYVMMETLRKCSRCKSTIDISYFGMNRKKEPYETCDNCRNKINKTSNPTPPLSDSENTSTTAETTSITNDKYIIVMDVETTGLIKRGLTPNSKNLNMFPNIVQFSWGLYTESGECKQIKDYIIKPNNWTVGQSVRYHGISQERALAEGVDIKDALTDYKNDIDNHCSLLVCHNMTFDKTVVASELMRLNMTVNNVKECCTMLDTINYCKLMPMVRGEYKWPSLEQLYRKCCNAEIENAHNSYYDVVNTAKCYFAVKD